MFGRLGERKNWREADVGSLHKSAPFVARACAQDFREATFAFGPLRRIVAVAERFRGYAELDDEFVPERFLQRPHRQKPAISALIYLVERGTGIR